MGNGADCGCDNGLPASMGRTFDSAPGASIDASRVLFRVGKGVKVSDALSALTFVKGSPLMGNVTGLAATGLQVQVQRANTIVVPAIYDLATPAITDVATLLDTGGVDTFALSRIGGKVKVPLIDEGVTVAGTTQDYADFQLQVAATGLIRRLDFNIGQGDAATGVFGFNGLAKLSVGRSIASTSFAADVRQLISAITPNGDSGTGEGIDCFFGGVLTLRRLMALAVTQGGFGEWKRDFRTGRTVFHYMGIPYYRTETSEVSSGTGGKLYGANLGSTGLQMIYAYGQSDTFGIAVQETPVTAATGLRAVTVHGAWALVLWEKEAIQELTNFDITATAL